MKKITSVAMIALLAVGFTSCKKDFTCTCKNSQGEQTGQYTYPKTVKKAAKESCDSWNSITAASGGSCSLN